MDDYKRLRNPLTGKLVQPSYAYAKKILESMKYDYIPEIWKSHIKQLEHHGRRFTYPMIDGSVPGDYTQCPQGPWHYTPGVWDGLEVFEKRAKDWGWLGGDHEQKYYVRGSRALVERWCHALKDMWCGGYGCSYRCVYEYSDGEDRVLYFISHYTNCD